MIARLARYRAYTDRSRWYVVLVQFILIVLTFLSVRKIELIWWQYFILIFVILFLLVLGGFIDRKLGMIKEEQRFYADENPVISQMAEDIKYIKERLNAKS